MSVLLSSVLANKELRRIGEETGVSLGKTLALGIGAVGSLVLWWNLEKMTWVLTNEYNEIVEVPDIVPNASVAQLKPYTGAALENGNWKLKYVPDKDNHIGTSRQDRGLIPPILHSFSRVIMVAIPLLDDSAEIAGEILKSVSGLIGMFNGINIKLPKVL